MIAESILDLIGNTPLVAINQLSPNENVKIYLKLEGQNPGSSIKDRAAVSMIEAAEKSGELKPGGTVLESSSGNTAIGLALVCKLKGYRLVIVLSENVTTERKELLKSYGAEIIYSQGALGSNGAIAKAKEVKKENPDWVLLYQYGNVANLDAHYKTTGPEILKDCPEVDVFVAGMGTSGTLMGVSKFFKENKPDVQIVAVEPPIGEVITALRSLDEGFVPEIFQSDMINRKIIVRSKESIDITRRLLDEAGIFVGVSTGAIVQGAIKVAQKMESGTIVCISPDAGWKYLSANIWTDEVQDVLATSENVNFW
jgi:cysteine synthase